MCSLIPVRSARCAAKAIGRDSYGFLSLASFNPRTNKYYTLTKVGEGVSDQVLRSLPKLLKPYVINEKHRLVETGMKVDVWFEPIKAVEATGAELTVSSVHTVARNRLKTGGLPPRFPSFIHFRDDKAADQATSVEEIYDMYRFATQRGKK
jgi:DNA ligase 1